MIIISQKFEPYDGRERLFFLTPEMAKDLIDALTQMLE